MVVKDYCEGYLACWEGRFEKRTVSYCYCKRMREVLRKGCWGNLSSWRGAQKGVLRKFEQLKGSPKRGAETFLETFTKFFCWIHPQIQGSRKNFFAGSTPKSRGAEKTFFLDPPSDPGEPKKRFCWIQGTHKISEQRQVVTLACVRIAMVWLMKCHSELPPFRSSLYF